MLIVISNLRRCTSSLWLLSVINVWNIDPSITRSLVHQFGWLSLLVMAKIMDKPATLWYNVNLQHSSLLKVRLKIASSEISYPSHSKHAESAPHVICVGTYSFYVHLSVHFSSKPAEHRRNHVSSEPLWDFWCWTYRRWPGGCYVIQKKGVGAFL